MNRLAPAAAVVILAIAPAPAQTSKKQLTFDQVQGADFRRRVSFAARTPPARWTAGGTSIVFGQRGNERVFDPSTGKERAAKPEDLRGLRRPSNAGRRFGRRRGRRQRQARLKLADGPVELAFDSPDGKRTAFVRAYDLWGYDKASKQATRLTKNGGDDRFNGKLDWVYQEEVYGRGNYRAHWWSPDSRHVAYLSLVEKDVPSFPIVNPLSRRPELTLLRYPKPGQPNPIVTLHVADTETGRSRAIDLKGYPEDALVVRVGWTEDGESCLFIVQNRIQTWLELCRADPRTGKRDVLIREEARDCWTPRLPFPRWLEDGSFLWESNRTGTRHVYRYSKDGRLMNAVTHGNFGMSSIVKVDQASGRLWCMGYAGNSVEADWFRASLDGKRVVRLTHGGGSHALDLSADGDYAIDRWSSLEDPGGVRVIDASGKTVRELGKATVPAARDYDLARWERLRVRARDGHVLDAAVLKPAGFDATRRYPVWLPTYSGPHAPTVRDRWNASGWFQFLAQQGFLVLQVNVRSASPSALMLDVKACYKQLGVQELADLEDAVAWVCANRGGDAARVGITGWSYGGFMTGYALTHSKAFALGVAGAGVYDWRLYDTIYTERYMSTPELNAEGYRRTSCIAAAKDLHGHLVMFHGTSDDNVHFQNCMQFVYALQRAGKDFELMIFPNAMHGVRGPQGLQRWRMTWRAMQRLLDA